MTNKNPDPEEQPSKVTHFSAANNLSKPGEINSSEWWNTLSEIGQTNAGKSDSIAQQSKNGDIWFCAIPFTQVYSEIDGKFRACCFGADSEKHTIENTTLKEWMLDSEYMTSIRREMLDPNSEQKAINKICVRCKSDEARYGRSRRTNCLKIYTNNPHYWDKIEKSIEENETRDTGKWEFTERIHEIQLKIFGVECNIDCHMCLHTNSTTRMRIANAGVWNKNIFGPLAGHRQQQFELVIKDRTKGVIEQVVELAPYIANIKVIGGEPLIMKKHYEMLDKIIETGHAGEICLKYQTNLTKTSRGKHSIFKYFPHFKDIAIVASVDGIGPVIEYMRRRTSWPEVVENIDLCNKHSNVMVIFNGLISFLSVLRFYEVINWCKNNTGIFQLNWAMVERPKHLRPNNLPKKLKDALIPKYKDWPDIVACLERDAEPDVDIQDIFEYLLRCDKYYEGTKWEMNLFDIFPELKEYYVERQEDPTRTSMFVAWDAQAEEQNDISYDKD